MWPKLIAQLLELLPHVSRLVPVADRYFSTKSASERAQEAALAALAENLRTGVEGLGGTQAGLERALAAQTVELAEVKAALKDAQASLAILVVHENRLEAIERGVRTIRMWVAGGVILMVTMLGTLIAIAVREAR